MANFSFIKIRISIEKLKKHKNLYEENKSE